ncbi:MAG TPA: BREX-1 system phosphatase PglZ type B [Gemmataceae bacterium]|nr:BREX-1 system phosphatase PglZ type B [Gemmataceae bacterium]
MTTPGNKPEPATVLGRLLAALTQACAYNRNDQVPPAVLLWTDLDRQWEPLLPRLRGILPHLLTLGTHDPATRTGPAIWLRCVIARTLPNVDYWPLDTTPILYLPSVSRPQLRAVEDCPLLLQPLAPLQYRGAFWSQINGKDWTVAAFLQAEKGGLGLDVARDADTQEALRTALTDLADVEVGKLADKQLSAEDFRALQIPDPVRMLLRWLNDPEATKQEWDKGRWKTFRGICKKQYQFDPEGDGVLGGAERLGQRGNKWQDVWQRFAEAPDLYPHLPERLRAGKPTGLNLLGPSDTWPQDNEQMEQELRQELTAIRSLLPSQLRAKLTDLEAQHGQRRDWVWAKLGKAPLARALQPLIALAKATVKALNAANLQAVADAYAAEGWKADMAMLDTLAAVRATEDVGAVREAILALYEPWLRDTTELFQKLFPASDGPKPPAASSVDKGVCVLFADGLRYDVGQKLRAALTGRGFTVEAGWHWAAVPPVTPTAKPAVSPVADLLTGTPSGEGFCPQIAASGKKLTNDRFHGLLQGRDYQILKGEAMGDPTGRAWTESGRIDRTGHEQGWELARRIEEEVQGLAERTAALLAAGWKEVRIITDHGWLLLPGGLPKVELAKVVAQDRWGRCAVLKPDSTVSVPQGVWHWSKGVWVALAPGISCFVAGKEYAHGSLSLQECLVPQLKVLASRSPVSAKIKSVKWVGLRCRVAVEGTVTGLQVDLRTRLADAGSSVAAPRPVTADGTAAFPVEDDHEGAAVTVVLLSADGQVIDRRPTTVGGEG